MPILIPYLVKLFISLGIVYLFYQLVLRRLTFYNANRWYLLVFTLLSFGVPFINITPVMKDNIPDSGILQYIPSVQTYSIGLEEATHCPVPLWSTTWNKWDWILLLFAIGAGFMLLRFCFRCLSFFRMRRHAKLISAGGLKIYHVDASIIPFSFGNSIFINSTQHTEDELREIIRHEFIHVKQRHTTDILWAEWLCMINWYNPVAWLLKSAIRQNLEFIADHKVLENGVDKKQYQYLLLKVIGNDQFSIAQKFNFSSLKKRIAMMNKTKSARVHLLRFLFMLPLAAIILISFREQLGDSSSPQPPAILKDTIPDTKRPNEKGYIINIKDDHGNCMVQVKDRNGKLVEKLLLTEWNENESKYEGLYGEIPPPPPPKPPMPPCATPPVHPIAPVQPLNPLNPLNPPNPVQPLNPLNPVAPIEPPEPPLPAIGGSDKLITLADDFEITDKKAVLHLKDGTKEQYDLTKASERKKFESKWGRILETGDLAPVAILDHVDGHAVIAPMQPAIADDALLAIDVEGVPINAKEDVLITITKYTTRRQLEEIKTQMKAKDIDLSFDEIEYNQKGLLISISGNLKSKDGHSNFVATDFEKLKLSMIKSNYRTYFKVDISNSKEVVKSRIPQKSIPATGTGNNKIAPVKPAERPAFLIDGYSLGKKKIDC